MCLYVTTDVVNSERLQTKPSWPELCPAQPLPPPHRLTFDSAFGGQFAAVALCRPHYFFFFLLPILPCAAWQDWGDGSEVGRRRVKMRVRPEPRRRPGRIGRREAALNLQPCSCPSRGDPSWGSGRHISQN